MPKAPDIQAIIIDPATQTVEKRWIANTLEAKQQIVGGYIEAVGVECLGGETLYCNEEGKWECEDTFVMRTREFDPFHGPCIIVGLTRGGDDISTHWTSEEIEEFVTWPGAAKRKDHTEALEALPGYGSF